MSLTTTDVQECEKKMQTNLCSYYLSQLLRYGKHNVPSDWPCGRCQRAFHDKRYGKRRLYYLQLSRWCHAVLPNALKILRVIIGLFFPMLLQFYAAFVYTLFFIVLSQAFDKPFVNFHSPLFLLVQFAALMVGLYHSCWKYRSEWGRWVETGYQEPAIRFRG